MPAEVAVIRMNQASTENSLSLFVSYWNTLTTTTFCSYLERLFKLCNRPVKHHLTERKLLADAKSNFACVGAESGAQRGSRPLSEPWC